LGFAPKFGDGHFRAAFTTAEGWGIYTQEPENGEVSLELHYGTLELREVSVPRIGSSRVGLETSVDGESARSKIKADDAHVKVEFSPPLRMNKGQRLLIRPTRTA
jgi:hypothetical protein